MHPSIVSFQSLLTACIHFHRVKGYVDHFHDVQDIKMDHIALARYVNELGIHILVEWDGMFYSLV